MTTTTVGRVTLDAELLDFFKNTSITKLQNMTEFTGTLQTSPDQHVVAALVITELQLERVSKIRAHILAIIAERGLGNLAVEQLKDQLIRETRK